MRKNLLLSFLLLLLYSTSVLAQTTYYVSKTGHDGNDGTTWTGAFLTLQKALDVAVSGDQIWVAKGTYYPDEGTGFPDNNNYGFSFIINSGMSVYGGFAGTETDRSQRNWKTNVTVLSGDLKQDDGPNFANNIDNAIHVVGLGGTETTVLDGFTITGGNAFGRAGADGFGGGIRISGSATISNCIVTGNNSNLDGGGIYMYLSSPKLINCSFVGNRAVNGGGIYSYGSSPILFNCSFSGNSAGSGGAMHNESSSSPVFTNCILWGNTGGEIAGGTPAITYSIVKGGFTGSGNKDMDPLFANAAIRNLHLQACSPAIDAGTATGAPSLDLDRNSRPALGGVDIGAYEFQSKSTPTIIYVKASSDPTSAGDGLSWETAFTKLQDAFSAAGSCNTKYQIWVAKGTYYPDEGVGITDNGRNASFNLKNNVALYGGFASTESQLNQRDWKANVTILSGDLKQDDGADFANNIDNSYNVIFNKNVDQTTVLDGFVITGGNETLQTGNYGGGMHNDNSSPTVSNCTFRGNYAYRGGGMANEASSPTLSACIFSDNTSFRGGGIYNHSSSPILTNCSMLGNSASDGGGMYNYSCSHIKVADCIFSGNTSSNDGAGMYNALSASLSLTNCSFWGNTGNTGCAMLNAASSATLTNCVLWGHNTGELIKNDIYSYLTITYSIIEGATADAVNHISNQDPLFVSAANGDLRLQACSPGIDAGSNAAVPSNVTKDLNGNTRIVHTTVDMGAYEYNGTFYALYPDADEDGLGDADAVAEMFFCPTQRGYVTNNSDCNDADKTIGSGTVWYKDADGDGYSDGTQLTKCSQPQGYKTAGELRDTNGDCNDNDAARNPATVWVLDADGDTYYGSRRTQCSSPGTGYVIITTQRGGDLYDNDPTVNPGAVEVCGNGKDDNCNGKVDEQPCYACANATSLTTTTVTCTGATFNWVSIPNPVQWQVQYKTTAQGSKWVDVLLTGNKRSLSLTGLKGSQAYIWHIRAKCGKSWTAYSNSLTFKTCSGTFTNSGGAARGVFAEAPDVMSVYPNPTAGQLKLQLNNRKDTKAEVLIMDAKGVVVERKAVRLTVGVQTLNFNLSNNAAGIYLIKVNSEDGEQTAKVSLQR